MKGDPNRNFVAALAYFVFFLTGLAILYVEKEDKFIRFHAMQSAYGFGAVFLVYILLSVTLGVIPFVKILVNFVDFAILIGVLVLWGFSMYKAYIGEVFKWPKIGEYVEKRLKV